MMTGGVVPKPFGPNTVIRGWDGRFLHAGCQPALRVAGIPVHDCVRGYLQLFHNFNDPAGMGNTRNEAAVRISNEIATAAH